MAAGWFKLRRAGVWYICTVSESHLSSVRRLIYKSLGQLQSPGPGYAYLARDVSGSCRSSSLSRMGCPDRGWLFKEICKRGTRTRHGRSVHDGDAYCSLSNRVPGVRSLRRHYGEFHPILAMEPKEERYKHALATISLQYCYLRTGPLMPRVARLAALLCCDMCLLEIY
jgi:hypothetical protein